MPNKRIPEDPYRSAFNDDELDRLSQDERDLLPLDRDFYRAPSRGKLALFAVAIALLLGAAFYGWNNTSTHQASNPPPGESTQREPTSPQAPTATRDRGPTDNTPPGITTG